MQKLIRRIYLLSFVFSILIFMLLGYAQMSIPDEINLSNSTDISSNAIFTYVISNSKEKDGNEILSHTSSNYEMNIKLFDAIPVKKTKVTMNKRKYVTISGKVFGIRMYTDGVMIVSNQQIETDGDSISPGKEAGLKPGDIIKQVNDKKIDSSSALSEAVRSSNGKSIKIVYLRDGKEKNATIKPVVSKLDGKYKVGLWVRDSTAGIGTMTFYDRDTGMFGGLGHAVCDVDTGFEMPISNGDAVEAQVKGCYKGKSGTPGELCGVFSGGSIGELLYNGNTGIYGMLNDYDKNAPVFPVALSSEIQTGKAQILSTVDSGNPKYYDIEIVKIFKSGNNVRNMVIKVNDEKLLAVTGGIVQGMSGTPIIQNGMLVGAVTHVFINDPTQGYAIFAENMLETAQSVADNNGLKEVS